MSMATEAAMVAIIPVCHGIALFMSPIAACQRTTSIALDVTMTLSNCPLHPQSPTITDHKQSGVIRIGVIITNLVSPSTMVQSLASVHQRRGSTMSILSYKKISETNMINPIELSSKSVVCIAPIIAMLTNTGIWETSSRLSHNNKESNHIIDNASPTHYSRHHHQLPQR